MKPKYRIAHGETLIELEAAVNALIDEGYYTARAMQIVSHPQVIMMFVVEMELDFSESVKYTESEHIVAPV